MSLSTVLFILFAILLVVLLAWASRPPKRQIPSGLDVFEALSQSRHCLHLPQILQILHPEDTEYLRAGGHIELMRTVRQERRRVALSYLERLQEEFETLLEISRVLAVMSPEVVGMQEFERWKLSVAFGVNCAWLRWRLRLGLPPIAGLMQLTEMATKIVGELEAATSRVAEATVGGSELPGFGGEKRRDS
jgi:hypothetical protein